MKQFFLLMLTGCVFNQNISARLYKKDAGLAHTFSIVVRDPVTGEMSVDVQSQLTKRLLKVNLLNVSAADLQILLKEFITNRKTDEIYKYYRTLNTTHKTHTHRNILCN